MIELIIIISLLATTGKICLKDWGFENWWIRYFKKLCYFCLGFWLSVLMILFYGIWTEFEAWYFVVPFACASLSAIFHKYIVSD